MHIIDGTLIDPRAAPGRRRAAPRAAEEDTCASSPITPAWPGAACGATPGLSATIVIVLAVAACMFSTALIHWLRLYGPLPALSPGLHQVEIGVDDRTLRVAFVGSNAAPSQLASHTRVSFPNYQVLAASGIPARQMATFRSRLWIARRWRRRRLRRATGRPRLQRSHNARFVDGAFFTMFAPAPAVGIALVAPTTRSPARPRVVLSRRMNDDLFDGADSTGKTVRVDGRPYVVSGVLAEDAPVTAEWDPSAAGGGQDAIYLPFAEHQRLQAWPRDAVLRDADRAAPRGSAEVRRGLRHLLGRSGDARADRGLSSATWRTSWGRAACATRCAIWRPGARW